VALLLAGGGAMFVSGQLTRPSGILTILLIVGAAVLCIPMMPSSVTDLLRLVTGQAELYGEFAKSLDNSGSSLGVTYVINQPMPVRLAAGFFYLQIFPIPFWSGFSEVGIYHLLKALNGIFMWFAVPLAALGACRSLQVKEKTRKSALLFMAFVYAGMTFAIAATSLETRHVGAFLVPLLILATVPDLRAQPDIRAHRMLLRAWLGMILCIHIAWTVLKFV
ncbi:MAG: hypothetical protein AAB262_04860, partial [Elusimicrobiota bacterium]